VIGSHIKTKLQSLTERPPIHQIKHPRPFSVLHHALDRSCFDSSVTQNTKFRLIESSKTQFGLCQQSAFPTSVSDIKESN